MDIHKYKVLSDKEEKMVKGGEILVGSVSLLAGMLGFAAQTSMYKKT